MVRSGPVNLSTLPLEQLWVLAELHHFSGHTQHAGCVIRVLLVVSRKQQCQQTCLQHHCLPTLPVGGYILTNRSATRGTLNSMSTACVRKYFHSAPLAPQLKAARSWRVVQCNTKVPILAILDWSDDPNNPIGSAYIIMEHAGGVPLQEAWADMPSDKKVKCIGAICTSILPISELDFLA
ncbi:conserved hypothetical protein, partial [Coccidioides posadasii str. Silveira]